MPRLFTRAISCTVCVYTVAVEFVCVCLSIAHMLLQTEEQIKERKNKEKIEEKDSNDDMKKMK